MPMPTITDLQGMYGDWNPQAYMQAQENAGLERQFRESQYGEQQAQTRQRELANVYSEQEQPGKMEQQRLTNQNLGYTGVGLNQTNETKGLQLERDKAMQKYNLDADQRKALQQITTDDIAMGEKQAQQMMMSMDPTIRKQGEQLFEFTDYARKEKSKQANEMAKIDVQRKSAEKIASGNNATQLQIAKSSQEGQDRRAQAKAAKSKGALDVMAALQSGKVSPANAAVALNAKAAIETDEEDKNMYLSLARIAETMHRQGPAPAGGGKFDVPGMEKTAPAPLATPEPGVSRGNLSNLKAPVLPEGAKKIGTSKGKDVYELPDGRKVIAQ